MDSEHLQQFSIKRITRNFLKVLLRNAFKKFLGSGLSVKHCKFMIAHLAEKFVPNLVMED